MHMCINIYIYIRACIYAYTYIFMNIWIHIHTNTYIHVYMHICIYTYIHIYAYYHTPPYKVYNSDEFQFCIVKSWKNFGKHFRYVYIDIYIRKYVLQRLNCENTSGFVTHHNFGKGPPPYCLAGHFLQNFHQLQGLFTIHDSQ